MSSVKRVSINPETFKITAKPKQRASRKINPTGTEIKFKKPKTVKYNKLLGLIRQKQKSNYDNLLNEKKTENLISSVESSPKGEFEESLNFLNELRKNNETPETKPLANLTEVINLPFSPASLPLPLPNPYPRSNQHTIKNHYSPHEDVGIEFPTNIPTFDPTTVINQSTGFTLSPPPSYGVLKNGKLPTYRQYMKTLSNRNQLLPAVPFFHSGLTPIIPPPITPLLENSDLEEKKSYHRANMVIKQKGGGKAEKPRSKLYYPKQKKTIRRTFHIGRSKHYSKIGVLINNKTIRDECSTKKHLLKQTPIGEVKRFLIKKGLIKTGSTAPNDVLRKMYESANMICGDIQNHNTDILLHNYFNEGKL